MSAKSQTLIIIFLILMILPFLILCFFNHPMAEDLKWVEEASRFGFIKSQLNILKTEGGRFFIYAVLCVNPLMFHSIVIYKISMFLFMLLFFYVLYVFIGQISQDKLIFREKLLLSLSIFFLYLYGMPSVSQGLYYLTGVLAYNLSLVLLMLIIVSYIRFEKAVTKKQRIFYGLLFMLLFVAIIGAIELAIVLLFLSVFLIVIYKLLSGKKINPFFIVFILLMLGLSYLILFSAGNVYRSGDFEKSANFFPSLYNSFLFTMNLTIKWITETPLIGLTILFIPIFFFISKNVNTKFKFFNLNPLISMTVSFCFLSAMSFLIFYSINRAPYERIVNFIYFVFLVFWFYNLFVIMFYLNKKTKINFSSFSKYSYIISFVIIIFFLFVTKNNVRSAYSDLINGTAVEYDSKMNDRYKAISDCNTDSCGVDSIKIRPKVLAEAYITSDPLEIYNRWYARYFNKKYIFVRF